MRTQVAIIGGGPSGLLLGQLLHLKGIETVVLERRSKDYVLGRIRAGVLEVGCADLLREAGAGARMDLECIVHDGAVIATGHESFRISFTEHTASSVLVYGQTELTRDLYDAREASGGRIIFNTAHVVIDGADTRAPSVRYSVGGTEHRITCDFVAGCDGFHGVSRQTIPANLRTEYEKVYPFAWLGLLSETPPAHDELIYSCTDRGFALCSMRNRNLSRYYIQCVPSDSPDDWTDQMFWDELRRRLPAAFADRLITGPSVEKSVAQARSFVCEPMQWGRLYLCGDAAHIVPPTGAKGLNTAASDVHYLYHALTDFYADGDRDGLERYSERALARVWKAERFSWAMTNLLHRYPDQSPFGSKMQQAEIAFLRDNREAQSVFAQNYVGLPY